MKKLLVLFFFLLIAAVAVAYYIFPKNKLISTAISTYNEKKIDNSESEKKMLLRKLKSQSRRLKALAKQKGYSAEYGFLIDMSIPSEKKRFFVYDLRKDSVLHAGLVAHGSCNQSFRRTAYFSNTVNTGCSSNGMYKVGYPYKGRFGKSYKLFGLDSSNSNAFDRAIVLHAYDCVPDEETIVPLCNSLGCPMISYKFRDTLASIIDHSSKPILLWISSDEE
jgi:hypothetical protein